MFPFDISSVVVFVLGSWATEGRARGFLGVVPVLESVDICSVEDCAGGSSLFSGVEVE